MAEQHPFTNTSSFLSLSLFQPNLLEGAPLCGTAAESNPTPRRIGAAERRGGRHRAGRADVVAGRAEVHTDQSGPRRKTKTDGPASKVRRKAGKAGKGPAGAKVLPPLCMQCMERLALRGPLAQPGTGATALNGAEITAQAFRLREGGQRQPG